MTEPQPDPLAVFLTVAECHILEAAKTSTEGAAESLIASGTFYAPRLFAVVKKVLVQHQPGRIVVLGALCPRHENHRHFSITSLEAADVVACQECTATVHDSCAGCGPQVRLDSCPERTAITSELLGKGE